MLNRNRSMESCLCECPEGASCFNAMRIRMISQMKQNQLQTNYPFGKGTQRPSQRASTKMMLPWMARRDCTLQPSKFPGNLLGSNSSASAFELLSEILVMSLLWGVGLDVSHIPSTSVTRSCFSCKVRGNKITIYLVSWVSCWCILGCLLHHQIDAVCFTDANWSNSHTATK